MDIGSCVSVPPHDLAQVMTGLSSGGPPTRGESWLLSLSVSTGEVWKPGAPGSVPSLLCCLITALYSPESHTSGFVFKLAGVGVGWGTTMPWTHTHTDRQRERKKNTDTTDD